MPPHMGQGVERTVDLLPPHPHRRPPLTAMIGVVMTSPRIPDGKTARQWT